ncbi:MAG: four helix bundle protein [Cytophagales bacterium]|nr:four helix bundle protein [Cytophagales bacterium]
MTTQDLKDRTKKFSISIARLCAEIYPRPIFKAYASQLIRASSSVGANYRAACRAKSGADFINKLKIVEEECDECMFFLEIIMELDADKLERIKPLLDEANEILSIIVASIGTARRNRKSN